MTYNIVMLSFNFIVLLSNIYAKYLVLIATIWQLPGTDNLAYLARLSLTKKKKLSLYDNDF